jgi:origin recognition complex subunit 3
VLQAFAGIVSKDCDAEADIAIELQARFARAVSELQFLGLVKPTKRKQDHVARLTWGYV